MPEEPTIPPSSHTPSPPRKRLAIVGSGLGVLLLIGVALVWLATGIFSENQNNTPPPPSSFEEDSRYTRDSSHVWYYSFLIEGADPQTFHPLKDLSGNRTQYSKDKHRVYYASHQEASVRVLTDADSASFTPIHFEFIPDEQGEEGVELVAIAKDQRNIWCQFFGISEANPETFELLKDPLGQYSIYAKDPENVWTCMFSPKRVEEADPASFEVLGRFEAQDKNNQYRYGNVVRE